jgi:hypothetical protein
MSRELYSSTSATGCIGWERLTDSCMVTVSLDTDETPPFGSGNSNDLDICTLDCLVISRRNGVEYHMVSLVRALGQESSDVFTCYFGGFYMSV